MEFDIERVENGITKYVWIMQNLRNTNISVDPDFQRAYNGFYRMRQRKASFYEAYFRFLEQNKNRNDLTFHEVLDYLYRETGSIHASFSSKMLATINPQMPIWDQFVLKNLGLRAPYYYEKDRMNKIVNLYDRICDWYQSDEAKEKLDVFRRTFPNVDISDTKKIDFVLWGSRENN